MRKQKELQGPKKEQTFYGGNNYGVTACVPTPVLLVNPMNIQDGDIRTEDIAHALSLLCRGGGHMKQLYTVGQHCLNCANEAKARGWNTRVIFACLLHDASEAYISDIIRPVKQHLKTYITIEETILRTIYQHYGLGALSQEEQNQHLGNKNPALRPRRPRCPGWTHRFT